MTFSVASSGRSRETPFTAVGEELPLVSRLGVTSAFPQGHQSRRLAVAAVKRPAPFYLSERSGVLALNRRLRQAGQVQVRRSACL
jgi:hypothetical protein